MTRNIRLFLSGDVMTGRGIDQILPCPGDAALYEPYVRDARDYIRLAEKFCGPIQRPVSWQYIWGGALAQLRRADLRIINLETAVTRSDDHRAGKEVLYRMNPANIGCIQAAGIDCCCLANNHVLDWGYEGLAETLHALDAAGVARCGAGRDAAEASAPAILDATGKGRVLVFSFGSPTSGVPYDWAATEDRPGVNLLADLSDQTAGRIADQMRQSEQPGDVTVASIHWGGNWGYDIPDEQVDFAHRLIDKGVGVVYGHSSHHVKALEVYREGLILYGCGDLLNDYEGISGYEGYRADLGLMYFADVQPGTGRLREAALVPVQVRRFSLGRPSPADARWLCELLNRQGKPFATTVRLNPDNSMALKWRRRG